MRLEAEMVLSDYIRNTPIIRLLPSRLWTVESGRWGVGSKAEIGKAEQRACEQQAAEQAARNGVTGNALDRIRQRLAETAQLEPPVEYHFSMQDMWSRRLFVALLRRYDIRPYRYRRQRYTTVMARIPKQFLDETLWPEFQELNDTLRQYLDEVTARVVSEGVYADSSEAEIVRDSPRQLPGM